MAESSAAIAKMKFDTGFDIDINSFDGSDQRFKDILNLFREQQLTPIMTTRMKIASEEIKEWCFTATDETENSVVGTIKGTQKHLDWGSIFFTLIKKKINKNAVSYGRILGVFLHNRCPDLLTSSGMFINASKRLSCALFSKWDRQIINPSRAAAPLHSDTRTISVTPPAEEMPASSPPPAISTQAVTSSPPVTTIIISSPITISSPMPSPPLSTSEEFHPLFSYSTFTLPSFSLVDDYFMDDSPSTPPEPPSTSSFQQMLHDILSQPSFTPSLTSPISTSTFSISIIPSSEPTIPSLPFSTFSVSATIPPSTFASTSAQAPLEHVDLPSLADRLYELLAPKLTSLLESSLAPLLKQVQELSTKLASLSSSLAIPSSVCLDSPLSEPRQGEMPYEEVDVPAADIMSAPAPALGCAFALNMQRLLSIFDTVHFSCLPATPAEDLSKAIVPLKDTIVSRTPSTVSEIINRYEPPIPFEDPENNPVSWTARMKELAALDQIKKAREQGKDTSNITTLSEQRKKELERYASRKFFNPEDYMKLHPEAVVPRPKSQTSLGAEDDRRSKKETVTRVYANEGSELAVFDVTSVTAVLHSSRSGGPSPTPATENSEGGRTSHRTPACLHSLIKIQNPESGNQEEPSGYANADQDTDVNKDNASVNPGELDSEQPEVREGNPEGGEQVREDCSRASARVGVGFC
ncbi:hypothetical protein KSP39_PZI015672 [Platanthera zijinensis]|uniref:Uncharacterized protein n=1 Tax=Platanthera zijinensis TaxID=2320716 RepID=A0AAP0G1J1_9ASPA